MPKLVTQCQPPGRTKCSTSGWPVGTQSSSSARLQLAADPQRLAVELQRRLRPAGLRRDRGTREARRLGQPGRPAAEPVRVALVGPRQRHPAAVAALLGVQRPVPDRVLQRLTPAGRRPRAGRAPRPGRGRTSRAGPASAGWPPEPGGARRSRRPAAARRRSSATRRGRRRSAGRSARCAGPRRGWTAPRSRTSRPWPPRSRQKVITSRNCAGVEVGLEQVEVERLAQPGRPGVEGPALRRRERLGHRRARRVVLVEDLTPLGVDLVHLVAVVQRVAAVQRPGLVLQRRACCAAARTGPWPGRGRRRPGSRRRPRSAQNRRVVLKSSRTSGLSQLRSGCSAGEEVAVPLPVRHAGSRPGRRSARPSPTAAGSRPGRCRRGRCSGPGPPSRAARPAPRRTRVPVGGVVRHDVDDHLDAGGVRRGDQGVEVVQGAQLRGHVAVVVDVVAAVGQRGRVERAEPDGVDAQLGQVAHPRGDAGQVTDAVTVAVGEAAGVDLVDARLTPPVGVELGVAGRAAPGRSWAQTVLLRTRGGRGRESTSQMTALALV